MLDRAFALAPFDGILEFGYDSTEFSRIIHPAYNMANRGLLDETLFAFYLGGINDESARV